MAEKITEGLVKALTTFPLMRLAGFYRFPLKMSLEQNIAETVIEDEEIAITGRFDILVVNKEEEIAPDMPFWTLIIRFGATFFKPRILGRRENNILSLIASKLLFLRGKLHVALL